MAQLDVNALVDALRHVPGFSAATRKWLQINPSPGRIEWQTATLVSTDISDFTEAAQDATGAMVANSAKVSLTYVDATPSLTADIVAGSLGPADIANRTRFTHFPTDEAFTATLGAPTHGTGLTDASGLLVPGWTLLTSTGISTHVYMPADWDAGAINIQVIWAPSNTNTNACGLVIDFTTLAATNLIDKALTTTSTPSAIPSGTAKAVQTSTSSLTPAVPFFRLFIGRTADTFTGNAFVLGVIISYGADS